MVRSNESKAYIDLSRNVSFISLFRFVAPRATWTESRIHIFRALIQYEYTWEVPQLDTNQNPVRLLPRLDFLLQKGSSTAFPCSYSFLKWTLFCSTDATLCFFQTHFHTSIATVLSVKKSTVLQLWDQETFINNFRFVPDSRGTLSTSIGLIDIVTSSSTVNMKHYGVSSKKISHKTTAEQWTKMQRYRATVPLLWSFQKLVRRALVWENSYSRRCRTYPQR